MSAETMDAVFIDIEFDEPAKSDPELAKKLEEVCTVGIFKATDAGRHKSTGRIVHPYDRNTLGSRQVKELGKLAAVGRIDRTGADREIVAVDSDITTTDIEDRGDK